MLHCKNLIVHLQLYNECIIPLIVKNKTKKRKSIAIDIYIYIYIYVAFDNMCVHAWRKLRVLQQPRRLHCLSIAYPDEAAMKMRSQ